MTFQDTRHQTVHGATQCCDLLQDWTAFGSLLKRRLERIQLASDSIDSPQYAFFFSRCMWHRITPVIGMEGIVPEYLKGGFTVLEGSIFKY
jgi:hypothetical protein